MSHEQRKTNLNYNPKKSDPNRSFIKAKRSGRHRQSHPPLISTGAHSMKRSFSSSGIDQPPCKKSNTTQCKVGNTPASKVTNYPNSYAPSASVPIKNLAANRLQKLREKLNTKVTQESKNTNSTKCEHKAPNPLNSTSRLQNFNYLKPSSSSTAVTNLKESSCISSVKPDETTKKSHFNFVHKYYSSALTIRQESPLNSDDRTKISNFTKTSFATPLPAQNNAIDTRNSFSFDNKRPNYVNNPKSPRYSENTDLMEWSPIDDETIVKNIHEIRKDFDYKRKTVVDNILHNEPNTYNNFLNIVVDTNIFLSNLSFLTTIITTKFPGFGKAIIVIPWMVIQELDYMKISNGRESLKGSARKAVQFINDQLTAKHPQFRGQTVMEASKELISSNNPDDGILLCCMQLSELGKATVLLSNDINLRNKAMMNNIKAFANNDLITELNKTSTIETNVQDDSTDQRSLQKVRIILSNLLTEVIEREMNAAYGDIWQLMTKVIPPFTVDESVNIIGKYWISVFSFHLQKQCKQKIDDFSSFLKHTHRDLVSINDFNKFIEYSLSLCIYLKNGYPDYKQKVADCILNIQKAA